MTDNCELIGMIRGCDGALSCSKFLITCAHCSKKVCRFHSTMICYDSYNLASDCVCICDQCRSLKSTITLNGSTLDIVKNKGTMHDNITIQYTGLTTKRAK